MSITVLLDLDGTLTDPRDGIVRSLRHALIGIGTLCPADETLKRYIGPPLQDSLAELLGPSRLGDVPRALALYRERYGPTGMFECVVYPGVPGLLSSLAGAGRRLFVCTSKPTVFAEQIVRHFRLDQHLDGVFGSGLDGTHSDKRELVAHVLARLDLPAAGVVMIGDRKFDVSAAHANGALAIGVTWGYGSVEELRDAGADALVDRPEQVPVAVDSLV
jgi:phosphoglycolate phosphatase